jgi:hypothetical protein
MRTTTRLARLVTFAAIAISAQACIQTPDPNTRLMVPTHTPQPALSTPASADAYQLPNVAAGQINVREVNGFSDEYNTWYIYGLVSNDTGQTVTEIVVEIQLWDASGKVLYTDTTNPALHTLAPGESSPFTLYTYEALSGVQIIGATIVSSSTTTVERAQVDFFGVTLWYDATFNDLYISGNVTNNSESPVEVNGLAASLHEASGALASANAAYPFLYYLEPGLSAPFRVMLDVPVDEGASLTDYILYADAEVTGEAELLNLVTSQEHYGYLDAYDKFHLVGLLTNNTEAYLNVRLVAGIFDDAGDCIDAAALYLPIAVSPGESMPYDFDLWGALDSSPEAYQSATQFEIYIDWYSSSEAYLTPAPITTQDDTSSFDGYSTTFSGNVLNNAGRRLDSAAVIVSLFDQASGELIATDYTYVSGPIEDGGTVPYAVYLYPQADFDPENVEFTITAFGQ